MAETLRDTMVSRGLEQMQNNAEDLISFALWNSPTFSFLDCLDQVFSGKN